MTAAPVLRPMSLNTPSSDQPAGRHCQSIAWQIAMIAGMMYAFAVRPGGAKPNNNMRCNVDD
jgi:hypothetical protein